MLNGLQDMRDTWGQKHYQILIKTLQQPTIPSLPGTSFALHQVAIKTFKFNKCNIDLNTNINAIKHYSFITNVSINFDIL